MSKCSVILRISGVAAATVFSGILLGKLASQVPGPGARNPNPTIPANESSPSSLSETKTSADLPALLAHSRDDQRGSADIEGASADQLTNWNETVATILSTSADENEKNQRLLQLFPRLPLDGQIQVAEHLSRLLPNQNYAALAQYLTNATTPRPVLDVLVADQLNRPDTLKLPYLLQLARDGQNPKAGEAKGLLEAVLDEDFGDDWPRWQTKVDQWVKDYSD